MSFSVVDLVRLCGYNGTSRDHWSLGNSLSSRFDNLTGTEPAWDGRPKTDPNATVPAAQQVRVYPETFRPAARRMVEAYFYNKAQQLNLFGDID